MSTDWACFDSCRLGGNVDHTAIEIGRSSRSVVTKVSYLGLECAAKRLISPEELESDLSEQLSNSDTESEPEDSRPRRHAMKVRSFSHVPTLDNHSLLLSRLRHPNIVQFFGLCDFPGHGLPMLVSEYLPFSLAHTINRYGVLPDRIAYSILRDVALGLCYLHALTPRVVHRRLTANNVLLTSDLTAKLGDVGGVSRLWDADDYCLVGGGDEDPSECYFPLHDRGKPDTSLDVFCYGVLALHVLCGEWPLPPQPPEPLLSCRERVHTFSVTRSEIESRAFYLQEISDRRLLKPLILLCLSMSPTIRPDAQHILKVLSETVTRHPATFTNRLEMIEEIQTLQDEVQSLKSDLSERTPSHHRLSRSATMQNLLIEVENLRSKVAQLSAQNVTLRTVIKTREVSTGIPHRNGEVPPVPVKETESVSTDKYSPGQLRQGKLKWTSCANIPVGIYQAQGVVVNGKVYIGGGITFDSSTDSIIFTYDPVQDSWRSLPPCPARLFGLGHFCGELVAVGGKIGPKTTAIAFALDNHTQTWKPSLPHMISARYSPSIFSQHSSLIACGGLAVNRQGELVTVNTIEMLQADTFQWSVIGHLPRSVSLSGPSCILIHDTYYLFGGYRGITATSATRCSHLASLSSLFSSSGIAPYIWRPIPESPYMQSTAASLGGCLLSIGGSNKPYILPVHRSIHAYSSSAKAWTYVGDLPYACCHCTTVSLPSGELLVVGGWVQPGEDKCSQLVYRGSLDIEPTS